MSNERDAKREETYELIKSAKYFGLTFERAMTMAWESAGKKETEDFLDMKDFIEKLYNKTWKVK